MYIVGEILRSNFLKFAQSYSHVFICGKHMVLLTKQPKMLFYQFLNMVTLISEFSIIKYDFFESFDDGYSFFDNTDCLDDVLKLGSL